MKTPKTPWPVEPTDEMTWSDTAVSRCILGEDAACREPIPRAWAATCAARARHLRNILRESYVGLGPRSSQSSWGRGHLVDWLLASIVARENVLLLGAPGVAKTEMVQRTFELLGLTTPGSDGVDYPEGKSTAELREWWLKRSEQERGRQKYFRYLLSRFTQPEELFGPVEISLLRQGSLVRVNFGLMTGPGVRAAFLDEIFKASSSILNSLLTLSNERCYFNWGGMERSDLVTLIGASNELPGGFHKGSFGLGSAGEDFNTLYAFLDRFPVRLLVPTASGLHDEDPAASPLAEASEMAIRREVGRFVDGTHFPSHSEGTASLNDLLLLGRCCMQQQAPHWPEDDRLHTLFDPSGLHRFRRSFLRVAADLQQEGTEPASRRITWTVSPRKVKAIYKIALAHAVITDDGFDGTHTVRTPSHEQLEVFYLIWDSPIARRSLEHTARELAAQHHDVRGRRVA